MLIPSMIFLVFNNVYWHIKLTLIGRNMNEKQRNITGMLDRRSPNNGGQRGLAFRDTYGFLTSDELKYWNENFCLDPASESTLPILHKRKETWNLNGDEIGTRVRFFSFH